MTGNVFFPIWCDAELCAVVTKDQTDFVLPLMGSFAKLLILSLFAHRQYTNQCLILLTLRIKTLGISKKWTVLVLFVLFVLYSFSGLI